MNVYLAGIISKNWIWRRSNNTRQNQNKKYLDHYLCILVLSVKVVRFDDTAVQDSPRAVMVVFRLRAFVHFPTSHGLKKVRKAAPWLVTGSKCHQKLWQLVTLHWCHVGHSSRYKSTIRQISSCQPEHYQMGTRQSGLWEYDVWCLSGVWWTRLGLRGSLSWPAATLCRTPTNSSLANYIYCVTQKLIQSTVQFQWCSLFPNEQLHFVLKV